MGPPAISDFNLNSEGRCFFCSNKILGKVKQEPEFLANATSQFQKYSVNYLARYLQMDMGKVFSHKGQIDLTLLAKVRRSRLKVELCEKCTSLNETFSGLYQQLEKLELEINSSLGLINEQLMGAYRNDDNLTKSHLNPSMKNEVSQIVDVLREEAIQKCSKKLRVVSPRVEIEKLTKKQIHAELSKHQVKSEIGKMEPNTPSQEIDVGFEENIKTEFPSYNPNSLSDDDSRNYDMDNDVMDDVEHADFTDVNYMVLARSVNKNLGTQDEINSLAVVSAASSSTNNINTAKGKHSINPETGRWRCSDCPMEFNAPSGVHYHYQSVHQKVRFKCVPCGKDFAHRRSYNLHHKSVHVGVRFKCLVCNKLFSYKHHLKKHQTKGCLK